MPELLMSSQLILSLFAMPPESVLLPYTTLFRSFEGLAGIDRLVLVKRDRADRISALPCGPMDRPQRAGRTELRLGLDDRPDAQRPLGRTAARVFGQLGRA